MRSLRSARFVLAILACVAALAAPTTAVAHGMAHVRELMGQSVLTGVEATDSGNSGSVSATDSGTDHTALHRVPSVRQTERQVVATPVECYRPTNERPTVRRVEVPSPATVGEPIPPPGARVARPRPPPVG